MALLLQLNPLRAQIASGVPSSRAITRERSSGSWRAQRSGRANQLGIPGLGAARAVAALARAVDSRECGAFYWLAGDTPRLDLQTAPASTRRLLYPAARHFIATEFRSEEVSTSLALLQAPFF